MLDYVNNQKKNSNKKNDENNNNNGDRRAVLNWAEEKTEINMAVVTKESDMLKLFNLLLIILALIIATVNRYRLSGK